MLRTTMHRAIPSFSRYFADKSVHQVRFATMFIRASSNQALNKLDISVQGLQGDVRDDPQFKLWLENCQRWGLGDCEKKAQDVRAGKVSLEDLFKEQELLLESIAKTTGSDKDRNMSLVSPQGIQGDNCERYEIWLRNCQQFGFGDCGGQLEDVKQGKKTLTQIFAEQDQIIREAAAKWQQSTPDEMTSSSIDESSEQTSAEPSKSMINGQKERLKRAVKDYGATVIVFHVAISLLSLGGFYALVSSGVDMIAVLQRLGVGEAILNSGVAAGASTFVVAYAVHKVFAPARIATTLTCVPFIVRRMRRLRMMKTTKKT